MVFERATEFPTTEDHLPDCPIAALGLRLLEAHRRGLLPRRPRRARPAATRSAARSTPTGPASCPTRRARHRPRRARPDRARSLAGPAAAADLRLGRADAHADPRRRHRRRGRRPRWRSPAGAERGLQHLRLARADRRARSRASSGRPAARTRTTFELEHLPTLRGRRPAPLAVGREGPAAARLGGRGRARRGASRTTVRWLREQASWAGEDPVVSDRRALITGITGQDGSYLAELPARARATRSTAWCAASSTEKFERIEHLRDRITLHQGDLLDQRSLVDALRASRPDEIYNLAAMSFVAVVLGPADADRRVHGRRRHPHARGDARGVPRGALLPGVLERDVRQGARGPRRPRRPRSTRARRTAWRRSTATSSRSTTASPTACTRPAGSSSTTSRRGAASSSSRARSPGTPPRSSSGCRRELRLGQPRRRARLGLRRGLRRGDVADAPAGRARGLRDRDRARRTRCATACEIAFDQAGIAGRRARRRSTRRSCARPRSTT